MFYFYFIIYNYVWISDKEFLLNISDNTNEDRLDNANKDHVVSNGNDIRIDSQGTY